MYEHQRNLMHTEHFELAQAEACELLDELEEAALSICVDLRDFRVRLSLLESLREKTVVAG